MLAEDIMERVRVLLDQNETQAELLDTDVDQLTLDDLIRSRIETAALDVALNAPPYMVEECAVCDPVTGSRDTPPEVSAWHTRVLGDGTEVAWGCIQLTEAAVRFIRLRMSDWEREANENDAVADNTPEYARQMTSKWLGVIGNAQNPVVCVRGDKSAGKVLEFFTCTSRDAVVEDMSVLFRPSLSEDGTSLTFPRGLVEPLCQTVAGMVLDVLGKGDLSKTYYEAAKELMG